MADDAQQQWSRRHGGLDPQRSVWISGWVGLVDAFARPLAARGVSPDVVTLLGTAVTALVPLLAWAGSVWLFVAIPVVVAGAVLDGVDGAVASRTGKTSRWGQVLDSLADRLSDLLLALTLALLGAPWWLAVALGAVTLLHESVRATAQAAGLAGPGAVTVAERPTRVIVASFALFFCGAEWGARQVGVDVLPAVDDAAIATGAAGLGLLLAVIGLGHLLFAVRRRLA
ncbi:CDP-alcohol phosphatidyltransferase family protein [Kribbella sp. CA-293567]|uniref:CDP-alcohol phosphatidyltransferase family protein n=1 Tax=Kribbella sp. CA-293567 TaxID=3002436 RepID=UPI0022DE3F6A|nr:CDP-alcohol phosphatidyltransferase family protein [Kribbella sp. CA-293567]WBQ08326.1 CDP-alcohol phosphatidyltransferase family protein [Kribbella sp. CA-293567]